MVDTLRSGVQVIPRHVHIYVLCTNVLYASVLTRQTHTQSGFLFKKCSYRVVDVSSILTH